MAGNRERICVIGAGVVGSILSAHLGAAGREVRVLDIDRELVDRIRDNGFHIKGIRDIDISNVEAVTAIEHLFDFDPDFIVICVKSYSMDDVVDQISRHYNGRASLVSFQNGLDTEAPLVQRFPRDRVFRAAVNFAGVTTEPACVSMTFFHPPNYVACMGPDEDCGAKRLAATLSQSSLETEVVTDIRNKVWRKAILNACLTPISVVTHMYMKDILGFPQTREIVRRLLYEQIEIARAEGVLFEDDFVDNVFKYLSGSGDHKASMLVDFESGRPLEIDSLNGRMQEYADAHGVPSETNRLLVSLVEGLVHERDMPGEDKGRVRSIGRFLDQSARRH